MKRLVTGLIILSTFLFQQCTTVPLTGRSQLSLVSSATMQSLSYQQYGDFMKTAKRSSDQRNFQMVVTVGRNIQYAVEDYMRQSKLSDQLKGYAWEYNLVDDKQVNAWCMPGGKVVVYSGILPITMNETGLAVVLGHEIAHAIAKHGDERMSQGLLTQLGGAVLDKALEKQPALTRQLAMTAFGLGAQLGVLLPFSRLHESEADRLGLIFMAMAGYDPHEAVGLWQRMAQLHAGSAPPEFLSTHPSDNTRIAAIQKELPEAMKYYRKR
ncbi:MAG: M48 family metallopeptidase [Ignavibacteria bacterium]|nr:M48 family metallopeptidase [Ignavibacteria bacterium]